MNKRKIAILAAAGVLTLALTAGAFLAVGVALAQDSDKSGNGAAMTFVAPRGADSRHRGRQGPDRFHRGPAAAGGRDVPSPADRMVADGLLTQEQADERYSWFQARPDSLVRQFGEGKREGKSFRKGRDRDSRGHFRGQGPGRATRDDGPRKGMA